VLTFSVERDHAKGANEIEYFQIATGLPQNEQIGKRGGFLATAGLPAVSGSSAFFIDSHSITNYFHHQKVPIYRQETVCKERR
jgi:hypothetical protein